MFIAATIAVSSAGGVALASDAVKIGGINLQYILDNTMAGKEALAKLKARAEKETIILQKKQDAVKHLGSELQQQRMMMRESTLAEKESNLRRMKRELELFQQKHFLDKICRPSFCHLRPKYHYVNHRGKR